MSNQIIYIFRLKFPFVSVLYFSSKCPLALKDDSPPINKRVILFV